MASNGHDHGHTPAAWTGVTIIMIGFLIGGVFTVMAEPVGAFASLAVVALGVVVGMVMRSMGLGKKPAAQPQRATATVPAQATAPEPEPEQVPA
jgi:UPF0716 family protein affecting phage T7 exclusion